MIKRYLFLLLLSGLQGIGLAQSWFVPGKEYTFAAASSLHKEQAIVLSVVYDEVGTATVTQKQQKLTNEKHALWYFGPKNEVAVQENEKQIQLVGDGPFYSVLFNFPLVIGQHGRGAKITVGCDIKAGSNSCQLKQGNTNGYVNLTCNGTEGCTIPMTDVVLLLKANLLIVRHENTWQGMLSPSFIEACGKNPSACKPLRIQRETATEVILLNFPLGGTYSDAFLYRKEEFESSKSPQTLLHNGAGAMAGELVMDLTALPDGNYIAHMTSCGLGGRFEVQIFTQKK